MSLVLIVVVNVVEKGGFFWWLWVRTELNYGCFRTYGRPTVVSYQRLGNYDLSVKTALYTPRYDHSRTCKLGPRHAGPQHRYCHYSGAGADGSLHSRAANPWSVLVLQTAFGTAARITHLVSGTLKDAQNRFGRALLPEFQQEGGGNHPSCWLCVPKL